MPNWCMDSVTFYAGEKGNLENVKQLQRDFETALRTIEQGDTWWIGRLLVFKGVPYEGTSEQPSIRCRSFVDHYDALEEVEENESFTINTSSAWHPMTEMYDWIAETYQVEYVLHAEEPGVKLYVNTDTEGVYYTDRYYIDCDLDEAEIEITYCESLEEVITSLQGIHLPATETMTLDELNQLHEAVSIYEYVTSL